MGTATMAPTCLTPTQRGGREGVYSVTALAFDSCQLSPSRCTRVYQLLQMMSEAQEKEAIESNSVRKSAEVTHVVKCREACHEGRESRSGRSLLLLEHAVRTFHRGRLLVKA